MRPPLKEIKIGNNTIGENRPVFIIAEAGVNHNGNIEMAKKLIKVAKEAGADAVKFQTFKAENLNTKTAPKSTYHIETTGNQQSWFDLLKSQELNRQAHNKLIEYCNKMEIMFLSTPYDAQSADMLEELDIPAFKIASTDANNIPFLRHIARKKKPVILSTAMCTLEEVRSSVEVIIGEGCGDLILMHCTANYPARIEDSNLRAIATLKREFDLLVGYSDHTLGYINPIAAVALGAVVYEKHFTLDKALPGPDHRSSLIPEELRQLVYDIRTTEKALGIGEKVPLACEFENRIKLRKSLVAKKNIPKGTIITPRMITAKRPGSGMSPQYIDEVVGKKTKIFLREDSIIKLEHLE